MIKLTREQFETVKRRTNPEVFTENQISSYVINYSSLLQKSETDELDEFEKSQLDSFDQEMHSFIMIQVIDSPKEDSLQKGLTYTNLYIREPQVETIEEIIKSEDKEDETISKLVFRDTELNKSLNRVGQELVFEKSE